jgi:hypothetical protein
VEPTVDLGGYSSWRDFSPLFGPVNDIFHLKIHWAEMQSFSFPCEIIQPFSVEFCVVKNVHEFNFRIVTKKICLVQLQ